MAFSASNPDGSVGADGQKLALVQGEVLDGACMARPTRPSADLHLNQPSVPQQHVAPL